MALRGTDLARLAAGSADLLTTRRMAGAELGSAPLPVDVVVYRVLGVRQVAQGLLTARTEWRALGATVDALHLLSMVPVAVLSRRWRRAALGQIAFSATMVTAELRSA